MVNISGSRFSVGPGILRGTIFMAIERDFARCSGLFQERFGLLFEYPFVRCGITVLKAQISVVCRHLLHTRLTCEGKLS